MDISSTPTRRLLAISNHTASNSQIQNEKLILVLPDGDRITSAPSTDENITDLYLNGAHLVTVQVDSTRLLAFDIASVGTPFQDATKHVPKYSLLRLSVPASNPALSIPDFWAVIYTFFTLYNTREYIPLVLPPTPNEDVLAAYLVNTGLGRIYPGKPKTATPRARMVYFLSRAAFWQGAGTTGYHQRGWLLAPREPFARVPAFTRSDKVITWHPARPPKPRPGQVLYRRWCSAVGQVLEYTYFDLDGETDGSNANAGGTSRHLAAFHGWHNDERVNSAWSEHGTLEAHRQYIADLLRDPGVLPCMMSWDGELMGYVEIVYAKENHVGQHYPSDVQVGDWERGIHVLVGEEKYLGGGRAEIWIRSLCHFIFLDDPRTDRVIGEPSQDNKPIQSVALKSGFHVQTVFDFPYKRSVMVLNPRERFFNQCRLY